MNFVNPHISCEQARVTQLEAELAISRLLLDRVLLETERYYDCRQEAQSGRLETNLSINRPAAWKADYQNQNTRILGIPSSSKSPTKFLYSALAMMVASPALPSSTLKELFKLTEDQSGRRCEPAGKYRRPREDNAKFLCTFCWVPHFPPAQPRLVGESGRMSCETCYNSLLDLSICWVCGEIIVRGEDTVSFGWCFWHIGCFGCLLCLQPLPLSSCQFDIPKSKTRALELEAAPLCTYCTGITDGQSNESLSLRGLRSVRRRDGGLSMGRYFRNIARENPGHIQLSAEWNCHDTVGQDVDATLRGKGSSTKHSRAALPRLLYGDRSDFKRRPQALASKEKHKPNSSKLADEPSYEEAPLLSDDGLKRPPSFMGEDGNADTASVEPSFDNEDNASESSLSRPSGPNSVYVSVYNPVNEPAFRSSPTKPIPKWMDFLPGNRERDMQRLSTEARIGSPISAEYLEPDEDDIPDDNSVEEHVMRSPSVSTPYPSSGSRTPVFKEPTSTAFGCRRMSGKFERPCPAIGPRVSPPPGSLAAICKAPDCRQKMPYSIVKDAEKGVEPGGYFALPRRRTVDESPSRIIVDIPYPPLNTNFTETSEVSTRKARYFPPDESSWKEKLRDRFRRGTMSGSGTANNHFLTGVGGGAAALNHEHTAGNGASSSQVMLPDDGMAEVRRELMGLFGDAN